MNSLIRQAMSIPSDKLVEALEERIAEKKAILEERDKQFGADRIKIGSYIENIALPELFEFDMNDILRDPALAMEIELRSRIFWLDNTHDDWNGWLGMYASAGVYFDMTLFGLDIKHSPQGVPEFMPHPISRNADLSLIKPFDFYKTGEMPNLLNQYEKLKEISHTRYDNKFNILFPSFYRGPLDIYIQMRGYDGFVDDTIENPQFIHDFFSHIISERARWNSERAAFLGEKFPSETTLVADDWLNIPFITPSMFEDYVIPAYKTIQNIEGKVVGFHTCGVLTPVAERLLEVFPNMKTLEISGWNDFAQLDAMIDPSVDFSLNFINTFVLTSPEEEQQKMLAKIADIAKHRKVQLCAQAIVRVHNTFDETMDHMNRFIDLAHEILSRA